MKICPRPFLELWLDGEALFLSVLISLLLSCYSFLNTMSKPYPSKSFISFHCFLKDVLATAGKSRFFVQRENGNGRDVSLPCRIQGFRKIYDNCEARL